MVGFSVYYLNHVKTNTSNYISFSCGIITLAPIDPLLKMRLRPRSKCIHLQGGQENVTRGVDCASRRTRGDPEDEKNEEA